VIQDFMDAVYRDLVPSGTLRAALSYGNTGGLLVQRDISSGELRGLAVDLIDELAQRLSVRKLLVGYEGSVSALEAGLAGAWDVAILAIDPVRARQLNFTPPFVVLEGTYAIRELSPCRTVLDLDRAGARISIVRDAVFDAHLTHSLRHAELIRSATYRDAADRFLAEELEAKGAQRRPALSQVVRRGGEGQPSGRRCAAMHLDRGIALTVRGAGRWDADWRRTKNSCRNATSPAHVK
jgi:polar amino acid transport system substrate-binding protein